MDLNGMLEKAIVSVYAFLQVVLSPLLFPHGYALQCLVLLALWFHSLSLDRLPFSLSALSGAHSSRERLMLQQLLEVSLLVLCVLSIACSLREGPSAHTASSHTSLVIETESEAVLAVTEEEQTLFVSLSHSLSHTLSLALSLTRSQCTRVLSSLPLGYSLSSVASPTASAPVSLLSHCLSVALRSLAVLCYVSWSPGLHTLSRALVDSSVSLFLFLQLLLATQLYPFGFLSQLALVWFLVFFCIHQQRERVRERERQQRREREREEELEEEEELLTSNCGLSAKREEVANGAEKGEPRAEEIVEAIQCKICFCRPADTVLLDCAHALCGLCCDRLCCSSMRVSCPFCKVHVSKRVQIFFP